MKPSTVSVNAWHSIHKQMGLLCSCMSSKAHFLKNNDERNENDECLKKCVNSGTEV